MMGNDRTMNYNAILKALGQASLFQLYRLNAAITNQLDDPGRITAVKRVLRVGQTLHWFDSVANRLVEAKLLSVNRTRARVHNVADGKIWNIPFYFIDLDGQDVALAAQKRQTLDRNSLRVGDRVGYKDRTGREQFGQVVRLNQKSASVQVDRTCWRVPYRLLLPVFDGALGEDTLALPGQWVAITDEEARDASLSLPDQSALVDDGDDLA